jgi:hypothetical protein
MRVALCDGPTLSETRGRPFVAPRAAGPRQVCSLHSNFDRWPQRFLFAAPFNLKTDCSVASLYHLQGFVSLKPGRIWEVQDYTFQH